MGTVALRVVLTGKRAARSGNGPACEPEVRITADRRGTKRMPVRSVPDTARTGGVLHSLNAETVGLHQAIPHELLDSPWPAIE